MRWLLLACVAVVLTGSPTIAAAQATAAPAPGGQSAGPVADAATYVGRPVEQLQVFVDGQPTTDAAITDLLETHVGRPLAMTDVRESIAHLYSLGRFQDVRVDAATSSSGGVSLRFDLVPLRSVQDVEFTGTLGLDKGLLRRTIADRYGARPQVARAADAARTLEALYRDHGYLGAVVGATPTTAADGGSTVLTFHVEPGPRATIADVKIDGDPRYGARHAGAATRRAKGIALRSPAAAAAPRRVHDEASKARLLRGDGQPARNHLRGQEVGRPHDRRALGPRRDRALRGRSAACRPAEGARACRAGELRDRRSPRGFDRRDPRVSPPAGVLERRRFMASRGNSRSVVACLSNQEGHAVLRRRAGPVERQPGNPGRRGADDDWPQAGGALRGIGVVRRVGRHH